VRALVYTVAHQLQVCEIGVPRPADDEVVVRVEAAGICGSDIHGVASRSERRPPPLVMGHEFVGEVVRPGGTAGADWVGRRVAVNPQIPCGNCEVCRSGRENVCGRRGLVGGTRAGGLGEYVCVPIRCLHVLPDGLGWSEAVVAEPLATCVHGLNLVPERFLATVVVLGGGSIGILAAALLRATGASRVILSEPQKSRRAYAGAYADVVVAPADLPDTVLAETGGRGADLTIDAVGLERTRRASVDVLGRTGMALWLGMEAQGAEVPAFDVVVKEQRIQGSFAYTDVEFAQAVRMLQATGIGRALSRDVLTLDEGRDVFARLVAGEAMAALKAVIRPGT
jgi:L-iditol 2-dehydrogenase